MATNLKGLEKFNSNGTDTAIGNAVDSSNYK
jgi:hypothetical protein